ncbi:MAG TPA: cell division protein FtsK [Gammaproteobacteria bacterium]|nr:cell division protein FtsK [Gammaproteobacteria bacterium]
MLAQARRKSGKTAKITHQVTRGLREGALLILSAIAIFLLVSLASYHPADPGWSNSGDVVRIYNAGGLIGAWLADVLLYLLGYLAYLFPIMVGYSGWLVYRGLTPSGEIDLHVLAVRWAGFLLTVGAGCGLATLESGSHQGQLPAGAGGVFGNVIGNGLVDVVSPVGATLFLLALFLTGVTLFTGLSWLLVMDFIGKHTLVLADHVVAIAGQIPGQLASRRARTERKEVIKASQKKVAKRKPVRIEPVIKAPKPSERLERERQVPLFDPPPNSELPPLSLLDAPRPSAEGYSSSALEAMSRLVEMKMLDFNIEVEVVAVNPGPVITRFELDLGPGVKVSQVSNLAKDIARALAAVSVRVVDVIPGKSVIGLEIPNEHRSIISLGEILNTHEFDESTSPLTMALGKDISGLPIVVDLARMPHLLVAGTTGSGKSVGINAMILSLLFKTLPKDVRLIMIDPKMLELSVYEGIPHLLTPVVTDMNEASNALRWCVGEMERRYKLMAALGVRSIDSYNRKVKDAEEAGKPIPDPLFKPEEVLEGTEHPALQHLPFIVIVIDELADMMMVVGKKVEELIGRLAQKARASGIHLVLATQRPSVDVITGLIKANIPTRIAFQVSSKIDSRTILDQMGAEQLLGHGDMLYMAPGTSVPVRVHGAFVSDQEVHKVAGHLKGKSGPDYVREILEVSTEPVPGLSPEKGGGGGDDTESDPLYDQAVAIVTQTRRASISGVQRRLKIGYNRAARMIEHMEETGIVSPMESNGNRQVIAPPPPEA